MSRIVSSPMAVFHVSLGILALRTAINSKLAARLARQADLSPLSLSCARPGMLGILGPGFSRFDPGGVTWMIWGHSISRMGMCGRTEPPCLAYAGPSGPVWCGACGVMIQTIGTIYLQRRLQPPSPNAVTSYLRVQFPPSCTQVPLLHSRLTVA